MNDVGTSVDEYRHATENARHYSALRFAAMTVFLAIVFGVSAAAFGLTSLEGPPPWLQRLACVGGLVATFAFWLFEHRVNLLIGHFAARAGELEQALGYNQWRSVPMGKYLIAPFAVRLIYIFSALFWLASLLSSYA